MNSTVSEDRKQRIAATIAFFSEAIRFIIIPLVLLFIIMSNFPMLVGGAFPQMANSLILFGGLLALFAALEAYFQKGSSLKMIFGLLAVVTLCGWFWFVFTGKDMTFPYGPVTISLDIVGLVLLILIVVSLKGILPVVQYMLSKDEFQRKKQKIAEAAAMKAKKTTAKVRVEAPVATALTWVKKSDDDQEPPPPEDFVMQCPICKSVISPKDNSCPHCGAWIRQKAKY